MRRMARRSRTSIVLLIPALVALAVAIETCRPQPGRMPAPEPRAGNVATDTSLSSAPPDSAREAFLDEHANYGFPLEGRHRSLPCDACHGGMEPKPSCKGCHTSPHGEGLHRNCEDCHTAGLPFSKVKFAHEPKGLFAFHREVPCLRCHADKRFDSSGRDCASCHADYHKGSLGRDCYQCHRAASWNVTRFDHSGTGFPLMGAHRALECGDCHRDLQTFKIVPRPTGCASCHEKDYRSSRFPHAQYGAGVNCQECHLQDSFSYAHSPAWFNIQTGAHAGIACATCHKSSQNYSEYTCHDCHAGHSGDRGGRCLDCHPGGFPGGGD